MPAGSAKKADGNPPVPIGLFMVSEKQRIPPLFLVCPFGCLQRVDLLRRFLDLELQMGGRWAFAGTPLSCRVRINTAVLSRRAFDDLAASLALVDDGIATAPIESAAFLRHEAALDAVFDRLTNHGSLLFVLSSVVDWLNSKKPTRFQNHLHGQVRSVIPFP